MKKALITEEFHPSLTQGLEAMGYLCSQDWNSTTASVLDQIEHYEVLVINSKIWIDAKMLQKAQKLKAIIRIGSGLDIIDLNACKTYGVAVISTPEGNANAVAEHVLAFILSSYNNIYKAQNELMNGIWSREPNRGEELCGKTIGIIGYGHNGSRLANLLAGFDTEVLIYDIVDVSSRIANPRAKQVSMDKIFSESDLVSYHIPLDSQTRNLINSAYLKKFRKPIDLINTSRGGICCMDDLVEAIECGIVCRAMLDVYDREPFLLTEKWKNLVTLNRVVLTPHIAGWTKESKKRMAQIAISKLKEVYFP